MQLGIVALPEDFQIIIAAPNNFFKIINYEIIQKKENEIQKTNNQFHNLNYKIISLEKNNINKNKKLSNATILISRSESKKGRLEQIKKNFSFIETSSIARKLALLAIGKCDLVLSVNPKNIWDIAGGIAIINSLNNFSILELSSKDKHNLNLENIKSFGIIAGHKNIVNEFLEFWELNNLSVFYDWKT